MHIITKEGLIQGVRKRWKDQYYLPKKKEWKWGEDKGKIYDKLEFVDTEEEIATVIGNRSWTGNVCDECNEDVEATIELGEKPGYESRTARICIKCLRKAMAMMEEGETTDNISKDQ